MLFLDIRMNLVWYAQYLFMYLTFFILGSAYYTYFICIWYSFLCIVKAVVKQNYFEYPESESLNNDISLNLLRLSYWDFVVCCMNISWDDVRYFMVEIGFYCLYLPWGPNLLSEFLKFWPYFKVESEKKYLKLELQTSNFALRLQGSTIFPFRLPFLFFQFTAK